MNLERMRHAGRQMKLSLTLPCCFASLVLLALLFQPAKSWAACTTSNLNPNPNPASFAAVGDFNGDCKSDLLWRNSSTEQVYFWLMNGTTFTSSGSPGAPTSDWVIQGVGDFDGDGKSDVLWRNSTTGEVFIWLMNGTTFTSSGSLGTVSLDWNIAGVGDFNDDGKADILWQNSTTGQVYIWFMNGTTMNGGGSVSYVSSGWNIVGIGDFDGDGDADILWQNGATGQVYVWLMHGTTIASQGSPGSPTPDWGIQAIGDFDGNGKSDILWQNSTTGQIYIWFMNGTTYLEHRDARQRQSPSEHCVLLRRGQWLEHSGRWRLRWERQGRHPVAATHHWAGLYLAHERGDDWEHRKPRHPRCCLGTSCLSSVWLLEPGSLQHSFRDQQRARQRTFPRYWCALGTFNRYSKPGAVFRDRWATESDRMGSGGRDGRAELGGSVQL